MKTLGVHNKSYKRYIDGTLNFIKQTLFNIKRVITDIKRQ